jgi:hypothetical protein
MKLKHVVGLTFCGALLFVPVASAQQGQERVKAEQNERVVLWPSNLSTLKSIPSPDVIEKVELNPSLNQNHGGKLDEQSFKKLMATAKPLHADDPKIKEWHYAPWYSGSFVVKNETYYFGLYLGGMGALLTPQKQKGMFTFEHKLEGEK